jgi:hypothetical protein
MPRKSWLIWFGVWASLTLSACKHAPKVNYCLPGEPYYGCSEGPLDMRQADGMICTSTRDQRSILRACKLGVGVPDTIVMCVATSGGSQVACSDGGILPAYGGEDTYTCLNTRDFDRLMVYCKRKQDD